MSDRSVPSKQRSAIREPAVHSPATAAVVEIESARANEIAGILRAEGFEPLVIPDGRDLLASIAITPPDVIVVGSINGPPSSSIELAASARRQRATVPVILIADEGKESLAVLALRAGVADYIRRSDMHAELPTSLQGVRAESTSRPGIEPNPMADDNPDPATSLLGASEAINDIRKRIEQIGRADSNVLITGETGTGKELVARLIQRCGTRSNRPFACINAAAIPDGLLESELFGHEKGAFTGADRRRQGTLRAAAGGTVFLDEIGDMNTYSQAKILRMLELKEVQPLGSGASHPVDVRIIAATNQDVDSLVDQGRFRADLYYRLDVVRVEIPPLRDRKEDLGPICRHFIDGFNQRFRSEVEGFTVEAFSHLLLHPWPGNVRELRNVLEAAFITDPGRRIDVHDLSEAFMRRFRANQPSAASERDRMLWALHVSHWNKSKAAEILHWSRMTLYRKMDRYRIVSATQGSGLVANPSGASPAYCATRDINV